jgi:GNAT superfamily N-acetyltransferase
MTTIEIGLLSSDAGEAVAAEVTDLVNRVYVTAEEGIWRAGATRTTWAEVSELIRLEELAVARLNGQIVGIVRVQRLAGGVGEFGMLAADPDHRGIGVGRHLVGFAERLTADRGLRIMRLGLLVPRAWSHPTKQFLHAWYTRIGYRVVRRGTLDEQYPHLTPLLTTPCDFVIYHKNLA